MTIDAQNIGKRFDTQWIFKNFSFKFESDKAYAIIGKNGSGKSTLLKTLAGFITPNQGLLKYLHQAQEITHEQATSHISFASPYMELIEELSVSEMINLHARLRTLIIPPNELLDTIKLSANAEIRNLSSGMKQRLKLALAIFTDSNVLLLDEPTSNFDAEWEKWYVQTVSSYRQNRLVIIASNHALEYEHFTKEILHLNHAR